MKKRLDFLAWAALAAALVVTASAEWDLARQCGIGQWVAVGVPASLDIYAIRALRARRDVPAVVGAMIVVQALAHLVSAGLLAVSPVLVVAVSTIAPLVLWRVHRIGEGDTEDTEGDTPAVEVSTTPAERPLPAAPFMQVERDEHPVSTPTPALPAIESADTKRPVLEICGGTLLPVPEIPERPRLSTEEAENQIRVAWAMGRSIREAARLSTRSPSFVQKVYARLDATRDADQTPAEVAA